MGVGESTQTNLDRLAFESESQRPFQVVYAIQEISPHAFVKVGVAKEPEKRVKGLQTGNPNRLVLRGITTEMTESEIHRQIEMIDPFARVRLKSEWFYPSIELRRLLGNLGITINEPGLANPNEADDPWGWRHPDVSMTRYVMRVESHGGYV